MYQSRRWGKKKMKEEIETLQLAALILHNHVVCLEDTVNILMDQARALKEEVLTLRGEREKNEEVEIKLGGDDMGLKEAFINEVRQYIKEHPMPKSVIYKSATELIEHLENADGIISVANTETEEFKSWFIELVETSITKSQNLV